MTMMTNEGDNLLTRAREGHGPAIAALVDGLRPRIARLAAYYASRSAEEAGDLEQEAWVAILEAVPRVRPEVGDPRQFLIKTGKWAMLNFVSHQSLRDHEELGEEHDEEVPAAAPSQAVAAHLLDRVFDRLTDRQAVVLHALLAGHTPAETARLLECSTANIAWHLRRIREVYTELTA